MCAVPVQAVGGWSHWRAEPLWRVVTTQADRETLGAGSS